MPQRQVSRDTPAVTSHSSGPGAIPTGIRACVEFEVGSLPVKGFPVALDFLSSQKPSFLNAVLIYIGEGPALKPATTDVSLSPETQ